MSQEWNANWTLEIRLEIRKIKKIIGLLHYFVLNCYYYKHEGPLHPSVPIPPPSHWHTKGWRGVPVLCSLITVSEEPPCPSHHPSLSLLRAPPHVFLMSSPCYSSCYYRIYLLRSSTGSTGYTGHSHSLHHRRPPLSCQCKQQSCQLTHVDCPYLLTSSCTSHFLHFLGNFMSFYSILRIYIYRKPGI